MTVHDDNLIFDRLADDELTFAEKQELLSSLDGRIDGWRRCALALLEAQAWRKELSSFVASEPLPTVVQVAAAAPTPLPARPLIQRKWLGNSLALAASAMVAFSLGWNLRSPEIHSTSSQDLLAENENQPSARDSSDAVTLVVKDDQGKHQRLRLPLIEADNLNEQFGQVVPLIPDELRTDLQNRGFDLKSKRRYAPLFFEQDEQLVPMVVPVNDTYFVPVKRPIY